MLLKQKRFRWTISILLVFGLLIGYASYMNVPARQQEQALQAQHPVRHIYLSQYLERLGIDIKQPIPLDLGEPTVSSGNPTGFLILGTGRLSKTDARINLPMTVNLLGQTHSFTMPSDQVSISSELSEARMVLTDRKINEVQSRVYCNADYLHRDRAKCRIVDESGIEPYWLERISAMTPKMLISNYGATVEVPKSAVL